ncbi:MAG: ATP-binding protein, partial [Fuerstiella sp.]|nr:ATP-binding protein [Fuerstiella sp.]
DLLPGPRNRNGLPESLQFWKTRIEETDPDQIFSVGLIYGPSGCGKSSLMKAGLLPRLSSDVTAIYVESTPDETETRILRGLRKSLPELPQDLGLVETFALLRRGEGRKVVVVLDQFEQWLHAHRAEQETELVAALRQCDGGSLQAVVMVRDDCSMAAPRCMRDLETRILEGHNFATVDLFDVDHAQKVLIKFGQAFGKLSANSGKLSDDGQSFVQSVASGLAQDGKVVSVRLALFAEMVKGKPWVPATLEEVGGTEGVGVNFLEETFSSREANPEHRLHQQAAREV